MRLLHRARREGDDGGFALITVIGTMGVLLLFVLAATTFAAVNVPTSRRAQDYAAAMAAAQAGVEDYLSRLNSCDTFWAAPCTESAPQTALDAWANVPGSTGALKAQYMYHMVSNATSTTTTGVIRVRASGRVNGVTRSITVELTKPGFLKYIYYTDYESPSAATLVSVYGADHRGKTDNSSYSFNSGTAYKTVDSGLDVQAAQACERHYYEDTPGAGVRGYPQNMQTIYWKKNGVEQTPAVRYSDIPVSCDINFVGGDVLNGPVYTNDAMLLMTRNGANPRFLGGAETHWLTTASPANSVSAPYRSAGGGGAPDLTHGGQPITVAKAQFQMPPTNADLRTYADTTTHQGCLYQGPTKIVLNSSGTMDVTSPTTTATNPGCGPGVGLSLPSDGVIYVDSYTGTCPGNGKSLQTYPVSTDITTYDCKAGDVFVQGTLKGRLTIASGGDIIVTNDLTYHQQVWNGTAIDASVTDVLGLVAQGYVRTYHPVTSSNSDLAASQVSNLEIDAAILSVSNSFIVQNFDQGSDLGTLHVRGGIYQRHRGTVGTSSESSSTGYLKDYVYDTRLVSMPPPHFLEPASAPWSVTGLGE